MAHHTNLCKKPDEATCKQCTKRHHYSFHNSRRNLDNISNFNQQFDPQKPQTDPETLSKRTIKAQNHNVHEHNVIKGVCPVQKVRVKNKNGEFVGVLAMTDRGSSDV